MKPSSKRPLSPHLQVYKPQITSVLSIIHRATGGALTYAVVALIVWLGFMSMGERSYQIIQDFWACWVGQIMLFGWTFCFFYHLANGLRHLAWDIGQGYELDSVSRTGWAVVFFSLIMTALIWGGCFL